jgi:membrane fusion protein (multidrug efflux system)
VAVGTIPALAQAPNAAPPAVGVAKVTKHPIVETEQFIGRVQAVQRVDIVARVTAYLEEVVFKEGDEVKKGDVLYRLERAPFEADVQAKEGVVAQIQAQLLNANITLQRAQTLLNTPAGQQSTVDAAKANQGNLQGQLLSAQAQLKTSQINLGYTVIKAPVDGKAGRTNLTAGNVVQPNTQVLTTLVGQDPMYVVFPISVRTALDLRDRYVSKGGFSAVQIKIVLPDGRTYGQTGKLNFVDNTVATSTDTVTLRGTIPNPPLPQQLEGKGANTVRELFDGEFVTVLLEGVEPVQLLTVPRAAVLTDQQGDYVYVVGQDNKAVRTAIKLGQSTPTEASVLTGLKEGDTIVVDGLQRVHAGQPVSPAPAAPSASDAAKKAVQ